MELFGSEAGSVSPLEVAQAKLPMPRPEENSPGTVLQRPVATDVAQCKQDYGCWAIACKLNPSEALFCLAVWKCVDCFFRASFFSIVTRASPWLTKAVTLRRAQQSCSSGSVQIAGSESQRWSWMHADQTNGSRHCSEVWQLVMQSGKSHFFLAWPLCKESTCGQNSPSRQQLSMGQNCPVNTDSHMGGLSNRPEALNKATPQKFRSTAFGPRPCLPGSFLQAREGRGSKGSQAA